MMDEPIRGFAFLADHYDTLARWSDYMASMGWRGEVEEFDESTPEAFFVALPGSDETSFAVWRSLSSDFVVADWRSSATMAAGETAYGSLDEALRAVEASALD